MYLPPIPPFFPRPGFTTFSPVPTGARGMKEHKLLVPVSLNSFQVVPWYLLFMENMPLRSLWPRGVTATGDSPAWTSPAHTEGLLLCQVDLLPNLLKVTAAYRVHQWSLHQDYLPQRLLFPVHFSCQCSEGSTASANLSWNHNTGMYSTSFYWLPQ